ncbi:hypothetical protein [Maridesulfovibrio sp.]|uniref:hypothetical protein n=1 Tax=Maridesulfovibrio sp. TaxID=2795000 RepID=UPI0029C9BDA1|nr:hypothetical protein [Maridesulfovibrio sp.]
MSMATGILVKLRSGGPIMVVEKTENTNEVTCVWSTEYYTARETFLENCLTRVKENTDSGFIVAPLEDNYNEE